MLKRVACILWVPPTTFGVGYENIQTSHKPYIPLDAQCRPISNSRSGCTWRQKLIVVVLLCFTIILLYIYLNTDGLMCWWCIPEASLWRSEALGAKRLVCHKKWSFPLSRSYAAKKCLWSSFSCPNGLWTSLAQCLRYTAALCFTVRNKLKVVINFSAHIDYTAIIAGLAA